MARKSASSRLGKAQSKDSLEKKLSDYREEITKTRDSDMSRLHKTKIINTLRGKLETTQRELEDL